MQKRNYGWVPDFPDHRDKVFKPKVAPPKKLPSVFLKDKYTLPAVKDQGELGSCTGNGIASVVAFDILNKHCDPTGIIYPSRLFIYYNERVIEGTVNEDSGAQIRDGIKTVADQGVCDETEWVYDIKKFTDKPDKKCYDEAVQFKALTYSRIDNTDKSALVSALLNGYPIVFGFSVYESFESNAVARTGTVPMPKKSEKQLGGHCVYCVGYDSKKDRFTCVNSWSESWGNKGTFTMPAKYICDNNLCEDFWIISTLGK